MSDIERTRKTTDIESDFGDLHAYETVLLPAGEGFDMMPRLVRIFGESIGNVVGALDGVGGQEDLADMKLDGEALGTAIRKLAEAIIDAGGYKFALEILKYTLRQAADGKQEKLGDLHTFNRVYQGNYGELIAALAWVLTVNFAPFFKRHLGDVATRAAGLLQKKSVN